MNPQLASTILYCLFFFFLGIAAVLAFIQRQAVKRRERLEAEAEAVLETARREAETRGNQIIVDARENALAIKANADREVAAMRETEQIRDRKLDAREDQLASGQESLRKAQRGLESSQTRLAAQMRNLTEQRAELDRLVQESQRALEKVSGMTEEQAAEKLMQSLRQDLEHEIGSTVLKHQRELARRVDAQAREMLLTAMQRYASVHTADTTTSTVGVPTDDMKGRIIGREGRNIRAFEKATGVDLIIDDTPGVVVVSGFDPVRREVARMSLEKLIADGRIHPSKIEETVEQAGKEIQSFILQKGQEAASEVNVSGLHDRVIEMLGRLHFRTSYSQNVLRHSVEVAFLAGMMAEMIGLDGDLARRCGLLHDIGKAADHELEGGHPKIGADLLRRSKENDEVVHAAKGHHDEIVTEFPYTMLVATADACSASRPGARRESLERYVKRMEELESIAQRFDGVQQAYAISAGRELRVMVGSQQVSDERAAAICRDIASTFEKELTYPGEIKVTVVREARFTNTAK
ncbi:Hydrolase (HAD superfamily) [Rhodopirellula islandica]|uniref:Ribonuclease Y n=1 Tax=Rhodopirellula islandica TaxID=595434 RepID=A0A0J1EER5_RHOIS|nr:ribonuclease Y [Rhodopirellula islandica]KLU04009.1 Hydrolase (HAD superfamily) [Rhodopirellula islandica]